MNKCDEQKQELSKMWGTEKKTEGKAFKNRKEQEVFTLQNNIQLILAGYNIVWQNNDRIGNLDICNSYPTKWQIKKFNFKNNCPKQWNYIISYLFSCF